MTAEHDWSASVQTRHGLRCRPRPGGGLIVEERRLLGPWTRVDEDVVELTRAVTRHLVVAPDGVAPFAAAASARAGVRRCDTSAAGQVVRAAYPLLAGSDPWPAPGLPGRLPPHLADACRQADPRIAARTLLGDRATRPVVRAVCDLLVEGGPLDLFRLDVAVAVRDLLPAEHLEQVLRCRAARGEEREPLTDAARAGLPRVLGPLSPRRRLALLLAAAGQDGDRRRMLLVIATPDALFIGRERTWQDAAVRLLLGRDDLDVALPVGPRPQPDAPPATVNVEPPVLQPSSPWTLHAAQTGRDLVRLSRQLHNCLDTYVGRLGPRDRVVEVRRRGEDRPSFAAHLRDGRMVECKGQANRNPSAAERVEVVDALLAEGWLTADGARTARGRPAGPVAQRARDQGPVRVAPVLPGRPAIVQLAARFLGPGAGERRVGCPDWSEVAAAFWLVGLLPSMPDPAVAGAEQAVRDLAALVVEGRADRLPSTPPDAGRIQEERDRLDAGATIRTTPGWRCRAMARTLDHALIDRGLLELDRAR